MNPEAALQAARASRARIATLRAQQHAEQRDLTAAVHYLHTTCAMSLRQIARALGWRSEGSVRALLNPDRMSDPDPTKGDQ